MRENGPFRSAGGPSGKKNEGLVFLLHFDGEIFRRFILQEFFEGVRIGRGIIPDADPFPNVAKRSTNLFHPGEKLGLEDEKFAFGEIGLVKDVFVQAPGVEGDGDGADFQMGQVGFHEFDGIEGKGGDAVPLANPQLQEGPGQAIGSGVEFPVGPANTSAANRGLVGVFPGVANHRIPVGPWEPPPFLTPRGGEGIGANDLSPALGSDKKIPPLLYQKRGGHCKGHGSTQERTEAFTRCRRSSWPALFWPPGPPGAGS